MRNIAICDDEPLYRERLAQSVRAHGNGQAAQLQLFDSPAALLQAVHMHGYAPDIAVLDIQMDEMTGIELAKQLNAALPQCAIIFVSSFLGFATDVYEAEHTYFILKSELGAAHRNRAAEGAEPESAAGSALSRDAGLPQRFLRAGAVSGAHSPQNKAHAAGRHNRMDSAAACGAAGCGGRAAVHPLPPELLGQLPADRDDGK